MGIEPADALGSRFDDLSSNHPHYIRVRDSTRNLSKAETEVTRVEVQLHIRGRDHSYVLKPVPLRQEARALGTLLILQDVTYLRDQGSRAHQPGRDLVPRVAHPADLARAARRNFCGARKTR